MKLFVPALLAIATLTACNQQAPVNYDAKVAATNSVKEQALARCARADSTGKQACLQEVTAIPLVK